VEALHDVVSLALGGYHSCALDGQGRAFCWGPMNRFGMHETRNLEAVFLGAPERLAEIVAGDTYTCARSETGHVFCGGWY
jgi:alpha-tubulin suppressor-like RCC1 family protein